MEQVRAILKHVVVEEFYMSLINAILFQMGLCRGTNNWAKLHALLLNLERLPPKGVNKIRVLGDSNLVIEWVKGILD